MKTYKANTLLFGVTIFVSSALLFSIQPMIAKMLLPLLGGTPAVWNTCMLFFQAVLLCGYAYALLVSRWPLKRQLIVQLVILGVAFISLPIGLSSSWANSVPSDNPSLWLLACLAASVGLPFFIVSSNSPLLQKWFSRTATESANDPYFLYAASNAGSLLALLAYPAFLEPFFTLHAQGRLWTIGYGVLVLLIGMHAFMLWRSRNAEPVAAVQEITNEAKPSLNRRMRWLLLAFAPSSLMLGVTNYITTDIASVPLLWIIPLALYLLTMIFAFARKPLFSPKLANVVVPGATVMLLMLYLADSAGRGSRVLVLLHLAYFFFAALMCHGQLAADRPGARYLAEFYVWLSLGGVLGGIFNALAAPMIFNSVIEYPLAILLSCLLLPHKDATKGSTKQRLDFAFPVLIFVATIGLGWAAENLAPLQISGSVFVVAIPLFVSYPLHKRPLRFALSLGAVILAAGLVTGVGRNTLHAERNFFGVVRVSADQNLKVHSFLHGSTVHGRQSTVPERRCEPTSYYHREGPLARIFKQFQSSHPSGNVGIAGLGAGGTITYARPGERWTFYEINPAVVSVAKTPAYFSYLSDCVENVSVDIVLGDARLKFHDAKDQSYDLIVLDAFSSDAIPVHLITQQALDLYLSKLANGGLLVFHISNRNLDLTQVVADLAKSRNLSGLSMLDMEPAQPDGKDPAHWIVMAHDPAQFGSLVNDPLARPLVSNGLDDVWTDDFSNILSVFKWGKSQEQKAAK